MSYRQPITSIPPSSQRRRFALGDVKNVAAGCETPISCTSSFSTTFNALKSGNETTLRAARNSASKEELLKSAKPQKIRFEETPVFPTLKKGALEKVRGAKELHLPSKGVTPAPWQRGESTQKTGKKEEEESVVPPDHTERDMMCTYLPLPDTYEDLRIGDEPPKGFRPLQGDFQSSYNEPEGWSVFDVLDEPKFRSLWSKAKAAAFDAEQQQVAPTQNQALINE